VKLQNIRKTNKLRKVANAYNCSTLEPEWRPAWDNSKFQGSTGCIVRPCFKKTKQNKKNNEHAEENSSKKSA
jgi:hypothetical protein